MDIYASKVIHFLEKNSPFHYGMYPIPKNLGGQDKLVEFERACIFLESLGYVTRKGKVVALTHKGEHRRCLAIQDAVHAFFRQFVPGVATGIFTDLLFRYFTGFDLIRVIKLLLG